MKVLEELEAATALLTRLCEGLETETDNQDAASVEEDDELLASLEAVSVECDTLTEFLECNRGDGEAIDAPSDCSSEGSAGEKQSETDPEIDELPEVQGDTSIEREHECHQVMQHRKWFVS